MGSAKSDKAKGLTRKAKKAQSPDPTAGLEKAGITLIGPDGPSLKSVLKRELLRSHYALVLGLNILGAYKAFRQLAKMEAEDRELDQLRKLSETLNGANGALAQIIAAEQLFGSSVGSDTEGSAPGPRQAAPTLH